MTVATALEDGLGSAHRAEVSPSGAVTAAIGDGQDDSGVRARVAGDHALRVYLGEASTAASFLQVGSGQSQQLVAALAGRRQIQIQVLSAAGSVHISLSAAAATTNHLRIDPGVVYSFPAGTSYEGAIQAISVGGAGGTVDVAVQEFFV